MTKTAALTIPGAEGIAAAYADLRKHGVAPFVARDWLIDQVREITRDDIRDQVERNHGAPAEAPATTTEEKTLRQIHHALNVAVAVYNRQRARVTEFDHISTIAGAAAINRAAASRAVRSNDTGRALLLTPFHIDTIQINGSKASSCVAHAHYVSAILRIDNRVRAVSARLESRKGLRKESRGGRAARITHFDVLMP